MNAVTGALLIIQGFLVISLATVIHLEDKDGVIVCRGKNVSTVCTTIAHGGGFLKWEDSSGVVREFQSAASIGDTRTLGPIKLTLNNIEMISDAVVYTSTASVRIMEETNITCNDGAVPQSIDIITESPSNPSWAHSACRFSQGNVRLSWNPPSVAPQCCQHYLVQVSTKPAFYINTLSINVPIGAQPVTATVYCIDYLGENKTSQAMTIDSSTALGVTIEVLNSSCDANTTYNISWTTSPPSEGVCTPPINMSTITCTTSSTHQSSNNTRSMICSAPANETINATVTVTNEAGVTTPKSTSAGLNSCIVPSPTGEPTCDQLITVGVAAIIIILLLAGCIGQMVVVYIVLTCLELMPKPKEMYKKIKNKCS